MLEKTMTAAEDMLGRHSPDREPPRRPDRSAVSRRGIMLVLSSPSGAGKTTLCRLLLERDPAIELSISVTTRKPRPDEVDGRDYHFTDRTRFDAMVARGEFLEWAEVFGNRYGTPRAPVARALAAGRDVLFDIDWQGTQQLCEKGRGDLVSIFVLPPSVVDLEQRLRARAQDSDDVILTRMSKAASEMGHWAEYDYIVINREVWRAYEEICAILTAERLKRDRQTGLSAFVKGLQEDLKGRQEDL
jgi:guanylate kinase